MADLSSLPAGAIDVREESAAILREYARVPIAFEVNEVFDVAITGANQFTLSARCLATPYVKDYDTVSEAPDEWPRRFDTTNWGFFAAFADGQRIGGAAVACRTADLDMLEGRDDLAVLWDIRVVPSARHRGVGSALLGAVTSWAVKHGYRQLKIETQNINVGACRFYARHGCVLGAVHRGVYLGLPDEIQLLWYKELL